MSYRLYAVFVTGLLIVHFAIGMAAKYLWYSDTEFRPFPFFSWSLFSKVPDETEVLQTIRIVSLDGRTLSPPVYFADAKQYLQVSAHSPRQWYNLFQDLVNSIKEGRGEQVNSIRREIERYVILKNVQYEVVEIRFRTIDFYTSRQVLAETSYGSFIAR